MSAKRERGGPYRNVGYTETPDYARWAMSVPGGPGSRNIKEGWSGCWKNQERGGGGVFKDGAKTRIKRRSKERKIRQKG